MRSLFILHILFILTGLESYGQFPNPTIVLNGVESELLARVGNKLFVYDAYANTMYTSDSTNIAVLHDFVTNSNCPGLRDYQTTTNYLYMAGTLEPGGAFDYFIIYKTDGITLDTLFMYSSFNTISVPFESLTSYHDTLYFLQRDSLMMASPQGTITNCGKVYGGSRLANWNDKIVVYEMDATHSDIRIFDTQSQSFAMTVNLINTYDPTFYYRPVFNNQLLYCDSSLKYLDPVTLNDSLIDSSLFYREVIGILNNHIICFAEDKTGQYGIELYAVDINTHQPVLIKDINPGTSRSYLYDMEGYAVQATHLIYFYADDAVHGHELWVTDGTAAGTHLIADYNPGIDGEAPSNHSYSCQHPRMRVSDFAYVIGDTLITGMAPDNGNALAHFAVTNGTQFYTIDLVNNNGSHEFVKYFTELNGEVYFTTEITPSPWGHLCRFDSSFVTGISFLNLQHDIEVFPNPAHNNFTVDLKQWYADVSIKILNTTGQVISTSVLHSVSKATLDLVADAGIYYVYITTGNTNKVMKLVKY